MKQFILIFSVLILFALPSFAQEQLKHQEKFYVRPDGRFFIHKNLPCYMWISNSPNENAPKHRLTSESSPQYSNPCYFDTEGYNTFRTPSKVDTVTKIALLPKSDIIFEIYADQTDPITSIDFGKTPKFVQKDKVFFGKDLQAVVTSVDKMSGVDKIYFSIDKVPYQPYTQVLPFAKEKEYNLKVYAVDNVGDVEAVTEKIFTVDITSPQTTMEVKGDLVLDVLASRSSIVLTASDAGSGVAKIHYIFDNGAEKTYSAAISAATLSEGEHTLTYYSVDNVANAESKKTYNFYVDKSAPTVISETIGDQFFANGQEYSSGRTKLQLTAIDNKSGVKTIFYSINNGPNQVYDKPFYFSNKTGAFTAFAFAVDSVNNSSTAKNENKRGGKTYIDLTGPNLNHSFVGSTIKIRDTMFISTKTKVILSASDKESGFQKIEYSVNKAASTPYSAPFQIDKEGLQSVTFVGYDNVNNTNQSDFFFVVDDTGPEIYSRYGILSIDQKNVDGKMLDVYPDHVALFLSATDKLVGYEKMYYSINGGPEKFYSTLIYDFKKGTKYKVKVRALDKLGNENLKEFEFFVE